MRVLHLFAGAGGSLLAGRALGWQPVGAVEWDSWRAALLARRFPGMPQHGDVKTFHGAAFGPVDLVVGGSPCQDFTVSGAKRGLAGDRSAHARDQVRVLEESGARWHLWENVPHAMKTPKENPGADFAELQASIRAAGHPHMTWCLQSASDVGAPHRRTRLFLLSWRDAPPPLAQAPAMPHAWPAFGPPVAGEPERLVRKGDRKVWAARVASLGDGWVPQQAAVAWCCLVEQAHAGVQSHSYVDTRKGWPTLLKHEPRLGYKNRSSGKRGTQTSLTTEVFNAAGLRPVRGDRDPLGLNPEWCESFMGWPRGWTDINVEAL